MSNSKIILKKAGKQAAQLAKDIAKSGTRELLEIPKRAPAEIVGVKLNQPSPIMEAIKESKVKPGGVSYRGLKNVEKIEVEMARLRRLREEEIKKSQQTEVVETVPRLSEPGKPILPSSPSRGPKIGGPVKVQTKIEAKMGKN
jgi:hypothetical protein